MVPWLSLAYDANLLFTLAAKEIGGKKVTSIQHNIITTFI